MGLRLLVLFLVLLPEAANTLHSPQISSVSAGPLRSSGQSQLDSPLLSRGLLLRSNQLVLGVVAKAKEVKLTAEEIHAQKIRKIAHSVDQVVGATLSGYCGPWIIGAVFGSVGGFKSGFKAAMRKGVGTGNSWGLMSAAFCGIEVLSREVRGKHDKWNNMIGACAAGAVSSCGGGLQAMGTGCVNFAGMSYLLDLLMERTKDPFDKAMEDPSAMKDVEGMKRGNKR